MSANMKRDLCVTPLYILLNGDIYADKTKAMVGSVVSDSRLTALDAFLDSLSSAHGFNHSKEHCSMGEALRQMVEKCHPKLLDKSDILMEVTSKVDLASNEMIHTFRIRSEAKK